MFASNARKIVNSYKINRPTIDDIFHYITIQAYNAKTSLEYVVNFDELEEVVDTLRDYGYIVKVDNDGQSKFVKYIFISW